MNTDRRQWSVPTDRFGPQTKPAARQSRQGLGARLVMRGNPVSFLVDAVGPCFPFLSLSGGQDAASRQARQLGNFDNESDSQTYPLDAQYTASSGVRSGSRSDLNGGQSFPLWGSRKNLPGIK